MRGDFFGLVVHPLGRGDVVDAAGDAFAVHHDDVGDRFAVAVQPGWGGLSVMAGGRLKLDDVEADAQP